MRTPFEFFPNMYMALINIRWLGHKTRPVQAVFRIPPKMGKFEVRSPFAGRRLLLDSSVACFTRAPR
jgi:hypothetical protein